ncbi:deoxyhypusine hydroxylase, putative [Trypanosoma equiperdum]|uniref:Deoxyhypusine hydroxylase n=1 Tax=Trypanosoma equiperdum TaxID=5694 RepID=A0A1G4IFS9_TRYEQ|nr:deoxyhypusine hydroxylase, putative [Trypanosoma equiperdum]
MDQDLSVCEQEYRKLLDPEEPLFSRTRELYRLKESILRTPAGVHVLAKAVDTTNSVLLQHELVYNLGQSAMVEACPHLERFIRAVGKYDIVTRHEAVEALGAIGDPACIPLLRHFMEPANEPEAAIRESCELALKRIEMLEEKGKEAVGPAANCPFVSIDPAPAFNGTNIGGSAPYTVSELENLLCDTTGAVSLWLRYQAMFTLRNIGTPEAVAALSRALRQDNTSALLRHEVAFVLGQLEHPASQPALLDALRDEHEAPMVRHEAAEALGAIADPKTLPALEEYAKHKEAIVRDSCVVALEMHKYWSQFNNQRIQH